MLLKWHCIHRRSLCLNTSAYPSFTAHHPAKHDAEPSWDDGLVRKLKDSFILAFSVDELIVSVMSVMHASCVRLRRIAVFCAVGMRGQKWSVSCHCALSTQLIILPVPLRGTWSGRPSRRWWCTRCRRTPPSTWSPWGNRHTPNNPSHAHWKSREGCPYSQAITRKRKRGRKKEACLQKLIR